MRRHRAYARHGLGATAGLATPADAAPARHLQTTPASRTGRTARSDPTAMTRHAPWTTLVQGACCVVRR